MKEFRSGAACAATRVAVGCAMLSLFEAVSACGRGVSEPKPLAAVGKRWVDAWSRQQRPELLALFDPDVIVWWPIMGMPMRGTKEVDKSFQSLWGGWSAVQLHSNGILVDDDAGKVAIDWTLTFTDTNTGNPVQLEGVEILQVRNGVVTADRGIFNTCSLLAQLRATPPRSPTGGTPTPAQPTVSPQS